MDTRTGEIKEMPPGFEPEPGSSWVSIGELLADGKIIEIEGMRLRIVKAYIQPGKPGRVTIRLKGLPGTAIQK